MTGAYLGVAYLLSAIEELHHDQVLAFRVISTKP